MHKDETIDNKITFTLPLHSTVSSQDLAAINKPPARRGSRTLIHSGCGLLGVALMLLAPFPLAAATGGATYLFDELSGTTAIDASGGANHGSISGASYVASYAGSALRFRAGQQDRVVVPQSVFSGFGNTVFLEAMIRPNAYPGICGGSTARATIFRKRAHLNDFELDLINDGRLDAILYASNGSGISVRTPSAVPLNSWTKVAVAYDGAKLMIMVNGQAVATTAAQLTLDWTKNYYTTQIGNNTTDLNCDYSFSGDIDAVTISAYPINQTPTCTYSLSTSSLTAPQAGSTGTLQVTASAPSCTWVASSTSSWISLAPSTGTGSGALAYTIEANLLPNSPRTGSILVSGQPVSVGQGALSIPTQGALVYAKNGEAWIVNTDGTNETQLTQMGGIVQAKLSNGVLLFRSHTQLYRSTLSGFALSSPITPMPNGAGVLEYDLNPEGTKLVFTYNNNFSMYTMNTDGSELKTLNSTSNQHQVCMFWARNGYIYFDQSDFGNAYSQKVYRMPASGVSPPTLVANYFSQFPALGGPNESLALLWNHPVKYIRLLNPDFTTSAEVPGTDAGDGAHIAYDYEQDVIYYSRYGNLYRVNTDGADNQLLAQGLFLGVDYGILPRADNTAPVLVPTVTGTTGSNGWYRGPVTITWSVTDPDSPIDLTTGCGPVTLPADIPGTSITCSATSLGGTSTVNVTIKIDSTPPTGAAVNMPAANASGWNNTDVTVAFGCTDALSGPVVASHSLTVSTEGAGQLINYTCLDQAGNSGATSTVVNLDKSKPSVSALSASPNPAPINTPISLLANLTDSGGSNLAKLQYRLNGGPYSQLGSVSGASTLVNASVGSFAAPAVIHLCALAFDLAGNQSTEECTLIAIYDPEGSFVTGAGSIQSPLGALTGSTATGRAQFAFQSKYFPGANIPTGNTQFKFKAGEFEFDSTDYQWLVVAGAKAQFKGHGVIKDRTGSFDFILTAIDGARPGGGGVDKFRIKITGPSGVVYDNNMGSADSADASTSLEGGNIVIHQ